MIAELTGIWVLLSISVHLEKRSIIMTRIATLLLLFNSILTYVEMWTQTFPALSVWRPILTAAVYSINPIILIIIMQITLPHSKKGYLLLIPEIICIPIFFTSQLTGIVCYFTEDNRYHGGPLSHLPYLLFFFYVLVFLVSSLIYFKNFKSGDRLAILPIIILGAVGVAIYYRAGITTKFFPIFTSAMLLYYLFIYIHLSKADALTGLLNRQCFYRDIAKYRQKISAIVSIDMNDLKAINDTKGHGAGDLAISTIAKVLKGNNSRSKSVYRTGGDEFVIIYMNTFAEFVYTDIDKIKSDMAETPYVISIGTVILFPGESVDLALKEADKLMYENKSDLKRAKYEAEGFPERRKTDIKQKDEKSAGIQLNN